MVLSGSTSPLLLLIALNKNRKIFSLEKDRNSLDLKKLKSIIWDFGNTIPSHFPRESIVDTSYSSFPFILKAWWMNLFIDLIAQLIGWLSKFKFVMFRSYLAALKVQCPSDWLEIQSYKVLHLHYSLASFHNKGFSFFLMLYLNHCFSFATITRSWMLLDFLRWLLVLREQIVCGLVFAWDMRLLGLQVELSVIHLFILRWLQRNCKIN